MPSGRPSIGAEFHERIEAFLSQHPELGYQTTAELVRDLLRRWLDEQASARHLSRASGEEAPDAATASQ